MKNNKDNLLVMNAIKNLVFFHSNTKLEEPLIVETYCNKKEQGYCLQVQEKKVAFSFFRNTMDLVVYKGNFTEFDDLGNCPSDTLFSLCKLFNCNEINQIVKYIVEYLIDE